jgi:uncharacterized cupredoxin-like copper-binding protein
VTDPTVENRRPLPSEVAAAEENEVRELRGTLLLVGAVMIALVAALAIGVVVRSRHHASGIAVSEIEYQISMPTILHAGHHTFVVRNRGTEPHEFVVVRTVLGAQALPRVGSRVDEASPLLHSVADSGRALAPGQTRRISATLLPGHYVVMCNLPSHYGLGMRLNLTVVR